MFKGVFALSTWVGDDHMSERVLDVTSVTKRYQTTVPKKVRKIMKLTENDSIVWIFENGEIKVRKA